jgi:hypothetical protein
MYRSKDRPPPVRSAWIPSPIKHYFAVESQVAGAAAQPLEQLLPQLLLQQDDSQQ